MQRSAIVFQTRPRGSDFVRQRLELGRLVPAFFHATPSEAWRSAVDWHAGVGNALDPADYVIVESSVDHDDVDEHGACSTRAVWANVVDPQSLPEVIEAERAKSASAGTLTP